MSDDDRIAAERQLERAIDRLYEHHPRIAKRFRAIWNRERESAAVAEEAARYDATAPYAEDVPDIANEGAVTRRPRYSFFGGRG